LPPLRAAGAVPLTTKVAARRAALEGKSVAGASTLKAKVEARKVALGLGTSAAAAAVAAPPAAGTKGSKAAASASSGGAGPAVAVPAGSLVCTTTAGTPAWCVRAVEVAAGVGGQSVAFVGAEGRSAAITLSVDGVVLRGAEAVVSYLLDAGGVSIAFGVPAVQHWLGWRAAAADSGADAKAVGKTLESSITASGGFLAGGSVTAADIVVAAWAAGTMLAAGKLPIAVQAWVTSIIGDAPVVASAAKAKAAAKPASAAASSSPKAAAAAVSPAAPAAKVLSTHGSCIRTAAAAVPKPTAPKAVPKVSALAAPKAASADALAKWLAATTLEDFAALSPTVHLSALSHPALNAAGITKCTDRKAVLRKVAKLSSAGGVGGAAAAKPKAGGAPAAGSSDKKAASRGDSCEAPPGPSDDGGSFPATVQEYFKDTYLFSGEGTVLAVLPGGGDDAEQFKVVLNQTVFHPQGGGQPTDIGTITVGESTFAVEHVAMRSRESGIIEHAGKFVAGGVFSVGDTAVLAIDGENRKLCARLHSAGHLLDAAMKAAGRTDLEPSKGYHFSKGAYVEYIGTVEAADREPLTELLNKEISALVTGATDVDVQLPDASGKTPRVVTMGGVSCPCGGTHVKNVGEIKGVIVTKIQKKKKAVRVSYTIAT